MVTTSKLAFRLFGNWARKREHGGLRRDLRKAGMVTSPDMYVSTAILSSLMALVAVIVGGGLFLWFMGMITPLTLGLLLVVGPVTGFMLYRMFLFYPGVTAKNRAYRIDLALPHIIGFIHAMSRSGANVVDVFRELSTRPDAGELRNEARVFMRDVEYLGHDPLTAIRDLSQTTPSRRFKEFLEVLAPIAETGGDMTAYFASKWSEYQDEAKADQGKFIQTLELYSELYITVIMLMPLLMLLVFALLGPMGGFSNLWLFLIAYALIPIGSIAFVVLISMGTPEKFGVERGDLESVEAYKGISIKELGEHEEELLARFSKGSIWMRLKGVFKKPAEAISEEPLYILLFSVPISVAVVLLLYLILQPDITACVVAGGLMSAAPYAAVYEIQQRKIGRFEDSLIDFLRSISSGIKSGLTLPASLTVSSASDLGPLTGEVKRMSRDMKWGTSTSEALDRFERRLSGSEQVSRATRTIKKASEADADIADVLDILMIDVATRRDLEREKKGAMGTYNIIMLLMFGIFLFAVYMVVNNVLLMGVEAGGEEILLFATLDVPLVTQVLMHATILEGIFTGLVAGQTSKGDLRAGLKYSILMVFAAYAMFALLILPSL
jgi:flagellar protein FlaJ